MNDDYSLGYNDAWDGVKPYTTLGRYGIGYDDGYQEKYFKFKNNLQERINDLEVEGQNFTKAGNMEMATECINTIAELVAIDHTVGDNSHDYKRLPDIPLFNIENQLEAQKKKDAKKRAEATQAIIKPKYTWAVILLIVISIGLFVWMLAHLSFK